MKHIELVKHHGLGNDFLVAFHPDLAERDLSALARAVCDRRRGLGADGLLVGESDDHASARMAVFNADGSRAEMSGNGIRCFAHALARRRGDLSAMTISTDVGLRRVELHATEEPHTVLATAAMGAVVDIAPPPGWSAVAVDQARPVAHLNVGNPHTVVAVDDVAEVDLEALGAVLPEVNLEVVAAGPDAGSIVMRVHERGVGITEACGTGACAAAVAAARWGLAAPRDGKLVVQMDGGRASVGIDGGDGGVTTVTLTGPTTYVATIEYPRP